MVTSQRNAANAVRKNIRNKMIAESCEPGATDCVDQAQFDESTRLILDLFGASDCDEFGKNTTWLMARILMILSP